MCLHRAACLLPVAKAASRSPAVLTIAITVSHPLAEAPASAHRAHRARVLMPVSKIPPKRSQVQLQHSEATMTMRSLLRRIRRTPSSQPIREGGAATACEDSAPQRQLRLSRTTGSAVLSKAIESTDEAPDAPTRSRKRDRLRKYLTRRRGNLTRAFLWPAMLSGDKDESRSSDGTDECDDVYMVDYRSDSDSDDDSLCGDNYVTPPVAIPELYRRQDRMGGIIVAGARVLFTFAGFKRQQMMLRRLQSVSEADELAIPVGLHREHIVIPAF